MRRLFLALSLALFASAAAAHAATTTVTIVVNQGGATNIGCPVPNTGFTAPVAPGTVICPITVLPSTWTGTVSLGGTNASLFTVQTAPLALIVGSTALTGGSYSVTLTTNP